MCILIITLLGYTFISFHCVDSCLYVLHILENCLHLFFHNLVVILGGRVDFLQILYVRLIILNYPSKCLYVLGCLLLYVF